MDTHTTYMAKRHMDAGNDENVVTLIVSRAEAWDLVNAEGFFRTDSKELADFLVSTK